MITMMMIIIISIIVITSVVIISVIIKIDNIQLFVYSLNTNYT